jgi:putative transposase
VSAACKLLELERSSYRYEPRPDRNVELREELLTLARQKPRYGYRRLHVLLERRGHEVNVKRVYRLYLEEGLSVRWTSSSTVWRTCECVTLEADTNLGSGRVTRVLERLIAERGRPENVRSDNGPEFTSRRMLGWAEDRKVGLVHIQPGRPMQNGHVESFHGRLRDEWPQRKLVPHAWRCARKAGRLAAGVQPRPAAQLA